uniref:Uncharacterized protein n=1 Tax=Graphocephala atropunctata TaxID=36148 RepID=A0A1B6KQ11_9HEMI
MICHCLKHFIMLLIVSPPTLHYPVPLTDEKFVKLSETEPVYITLERLEGRPPSQSERQKREEPEEWTEGEQQESLNADAMETIRKINPLTIANQVSQLFRKNDHKSSASEKSSARVVQNILGNEEESSSPDKSGVAEEVANFAVQPDSEELVRNPSPPYVHQESPKIVHKPRANDFGYSVIVLAGDPVNMPIKVLSKGMQEDQETQGKEVMEGKVDVKENPDRNGYSDENMNPKGKVSNEEMRVPKQFNVKTEFPVYDEDLSFMPDPFQGILDENYWKEQGSQEGGSSIPQKENQRFQPHAIYMRSSDGQAQNGAIAGEFQCGGWRKNTTEVLTR